MLETLVVRNMKDNKYGYYFSITHAVWTKIMAFSLFWGVQTSAFKHLIKNFAEFICHYENFCNFVVGEHNDNCFCLKFSTLKLISLSLITKFSATYISSNSRNIINH